ncbi:MAG: hypothetical protein ABSE59_03890 [Opitutaceae bacterium]|jgi:hypothetical protein
MSLSNDIISLLRDEAYLTLCRERLDQIPKGAAGAGEAARNASPLDNLLARIDDLEDWLKAALHSKLHDYLYAESHEYRYSRDVLTAIAAWEQWVNPYGDCLLAFAHELKNAARTLGGANQNLHATFDSHAESMAQLRLSARDLDRASLQLDTAARNLSQVISGTIYEKVRVPTPPFTGLAQWVQRLELRSNVEAMVEMQAMETEARALVASKLLPLHSRTTTAREVVTEAQRDYFENYWDELRGHALSHYVEDRAMDEVLDELSARHAAAVQGGHQVMPREPSLLCA